MDDKTIAKYILGYLDGGDVGFINNPSKAGNFAGMNNFLVSNKLTPEAVTKALQSTGIGDANTVASFAAQHPELSAWAGGNMNPFATKASTTNPATAQPNQNAGQPNPLLGSQLGGGQIHDYITQQGLQNDPQAIYKAAQQYGVSGSQLDAAQGWNAGTANDWVKQNGLSALTPQQGVGTPQNPYTPQTQAQTPVANPYQAPQPYQAPTQQNYQQTTTPNQGSGSNPYLQGNLGMGGSYLGQPMGYAQNPYTAMMASAMGQNVGDMLSRSALPAINNNAVATGGVGGSRQGVAQGLAIGEATKGLTQGLGNLYSTQWNNDQNLGLQGDALNLNVYNANQNWMNQGQQNQVNYMDKLMNWNQQGLQTANQQQNTPLNYAQQFGQMANQAGGQGSSQNMPGNQWLGALGGYQLGAKMFGG